MPPDTALDGEQSPASTDANDLHENVDSCSVFANIKVAEAGLEHSAISSIVSQVAAESGAESGALGSNFGPAMQEAAHVWIALSEDAKRAMCAIVRVTVGNPNGTRVR